jgi:hypothetical protein
VPAWGWQLLGAVCGLGLGLLLGALRLRKQAQARSRNAQARTQAQRAGRPTVAATTAPGAFSPTLTEPAASRMSSAVTRPAALSTSPAPLDDIGGPEAIERLRDANLDLGARLRAATDLHARELLERSQEQQVDQQRHERQLEDLRQQHAAELSHLMTVMVEQVDAMQRDHVQQVRTLEAEVERMRRQRSSHDSPTEVSTMPVTMISGGDMQVPPGSIRRGSAKIS